ncbi:neuraminidase-like domain-containing protein [Desulfosporosinus sp. BG]|uniref:neuraminidase-like domain-containing protein n=1 Tax=Desulfosporosinus sp. BG TaxID=1633135 RepID=UPI00083B7F68|nr:neuraminidase-like domain-containing protein [Desulfosporosinus sp. BG]ODA39374.1 Insecticidal toxin complex protein TccB1 [Desulfosporosinus sp. BG]
MKLQGRNLSIRMEGNDVKLLQDVLQRQGYHIPADEQKRNYFGSGTHAAVLELQNKHNLAATGIVDELTAGLIGTENEMRKPEGGRNPGHFVVKGHIRATDGTPVAGVTVRAFDKGLANRTNLHGEIQLGVDTVTDASGQYCITYDSGWFTRPGKSWVNLFIRVYTPRLNSKVIAASPVVFRAKKEETIDLMISGEEFRGRSEYEKLLAELAPVLQGIQPVNLTQEDIRVLAGETGLGQQHIEYLVAAAKLAGTTGLPAEVFYSLARQKLPTSLAVLLVQNPQEQRRALETAIRDNIIPARLRSELDTISRRMQQLRVELALGKTGESEQTLLSKLLDTTLTPVSRELRETLVHTYLQHHDSLEDFWPGLEGKPEFNLKMVHDLQFTVQLGTLALNHLPLVQKLQQMRRSGELRSPQGLARIDWEEMITSQVDGHVIGFPDGTLGKDDAEKSRNYARSIADTVEDAFPTAVVAYRVGNDDVPENKDLNRFFNNSIFNNDGTSGCPEFDFETTHIDRYLSEHHEVLLTDVTEPDDLKSRLKSMQRVFKITPRYVEMRVLLTDGLDSAQSIVSMGQSNFKQRYVELLGSSEKAELVYDQAEQVSAMSQALISKYGAAFNSVGTAVTPPLPQPSEKELPDWPTLFGALDFCDCDECRSVFSPAAYLVDLLEFLKHKSRQITIMNKKYNAKDILFLRRPDIGQTELSCENTNVPVPYIDLVNEVLEYAITPNISPPSLQTRGNPEELRANPEYVNDNAYIKLASAAFPWSLPFDRPLEAVRTYLDNLGVKRCQLMETFAKTGKPSPSDPAIAYEYLELTPVEAQIITNTAPSEPWSYWGYQDGAKWQSDLTNIQKFLDRSGLSYQELNALLDTRFINPDSANPAVNIKPQTTCQLDQMTLAVTPAGALEPTLGRIHRFVRLWRKLGWKMSELDQALAALADGDFSEQFLSQLSLTQRLMNELNLPLAQVLSLWATIDTHGENSLYHKQDSLYHRLFQNKTVINPLDADFTLNSDGSQLDSPAGKISDHISTILAALRLSVADLDLIRDDANLSDTDVAALTLEHLSILYRYKVLAKALHLKVKDLIALKKLSGVNPFSELELPSVQHPYGQFIDKDPARTWRFAGIVQNVQQSGFSVAQLNYIYGDVTGQPGGIAPRQDSVALLTKNLLDGLAKIAADNTLSGDPTGEITRSKLASIMEADAAGQVVTIINGNAVFSEPLNPLPTISLPGKIAYDALNHLLILSGAMSLDERDLLLCLSEDGGYQKAVGELYHEGQNVDTAILLRLPPTLAFPASGQHKIMYDKKLKRLSFSGSMTPAEKALLLDLAADQAYQAAVMGIFQQARDLLKGAFSTFLAEPALSDAVAKLLDGEPLTPGGQSLTMEGKFNYILARLLPYLREKLSRNLVEQTLSDDLQMDSATIQLLLEKVLKSGNDPEKFAIDDFLALLGDGLTAQYFGQANFMGSPSLTRIDPTIDLNLRPGSNDPAINSTAFSVRWMGKLLPQFDESYTFYINKVANLNLWIGNNPVTDPIDLKAGCLYDIKVEYSMAGSGGPGQANAQLRWSSKSTPTQIIPQSQLYSSSAFAFDQPLTSYYWLYKITLLINGFSMTARELEHIVLLHPDDFVVLLDPADPAKQAAFWIKLPMQPIVEKYTNDMSAALFTQWLRLYDLFNLRDSLPKGEIDLIDVFQAALHNDVEQKLAQATGWDVQAIDALINKGFSLQVADLRTEKWLVRFQACMELVKRLGAAVPQLFDWAGNAPDASQAKDVKQIVKAKYDDDQWYAVAKPLQDTLREKQRAALLSYLLVHPELVDKISLKDADELYEHFLIDVEMGARMMTSRIKQAISSVQLFIQRCLIGLENNAVLSEEAAKEWKWMKNYRVWEANRKVFIYPENWIEPELRDVDDKSPFFKELESEMLQNAITTDTAKTAFRNYMEKLDSVSSLEVCGMFHQLEFTREGQIETNHLHVFARTKNDQVRTYFYRRLVDATFCWPGNWTPWEKVDLDINGDHLIPVVYERRLRLYWPIFTVKTENTDSDPLPSTLADAKKPKKYWEIQLAMSEFKNGKWSAKKVAPEVIRTARQYTRLLTDNEKELFKRLHSIEFDLDALKSVLDSLVFKSLKDQCNSAKTELEALVKEIDTKQLESEENVLNIIITNLQIEVDMCKPVDFKTEIDIYSPPATTTCDKPFDEKGKKNFTFLPVALPEQLTILCFENPQEIPEPEIDTAVIK